MFNLRVTYSGLTIKISFFYYVPSKVIFVVYLKVLNKQGWIKTVNLQLKKIQAIVHSSSEEIWIQIGSTLET